MKRALVLNHFAVPAGAAGGTRHTELFSRLHGWSHLIAVANTSAGQTQSDEPSAGFAPVAAMSYTSNNWARVANWVSYGVSATSHFVKGHRPDVVYGSSPHLFAGLAAYTLSQRWRVPFVLEIRDLWPQVLVDMGQLKATSPVYRALEKLESFLYSKADAIVVLASGTADYLVARGIPEDKILLIPNAADPEDFVVDASREELRARYGFVRKTFVYAGAHGPANGLNLLLNGAADTGDADFDVVLVGEGVAKDDLIVQAKNLGLTNVRFCDPIPKSEIPELLAASDVGLHVLADVPLFRYGVSPNKVFDYMAAGLPVLTNTPGVVGDLVSSAEAGVVVSPSNIADGLREMSALSATDLESLGAAGKRFMSEQHSRSQMAERLQLLLDRLVE